jgi:hypothetical protein
MNNFEIEQIGPDHRLEDVKVKKKFGCKRREFRGILGEA